MGGNNCGKTSIIEALKAFNGNATPSFSIGKRNVKSNSIIEIALYTNDKVNTVKTVEVGGSETETTKNFEQSIYILPSRRHISYEFGKSERDRDSYIKQEGALGNNREALLGTFSRRLFQVLKHKEDFDNVLERILGEHISWIIEQSDNGQYFIRYSFGNINHNSEGIGDGIWSAFTLADALYDSKVGDVIAIDEPELSLHPAYQKRLMKVLMDYSKDRQIILSTHSPYFVNWEAIANGANLIRTVKDENFNIQCYMLSEEFKKKIAGFLDNLNNPHILGLSATEAFFLEDRIILVEGQEDVVIFNRISEQIGQNFIGEIFGWGVGGAPNMDTFL